MPTAPRVLFLFIFLKPPVAYFRGCALLSRHSVRLWSHLPFDLFQRWRISEGVFCSKTRHSTLSSFWVLCYTIQLSLTSKILSFFPLSISICQPRSSSVSTWLPRGCVDTSSHQLSVLCKFASRFCFSRWLARTDTARSDQPPFVRYYYCRISHQRAKPGLGTKTRTKLEY